MPSVFILNIMRAKFIFFGAIMAIFGLVASCSRRPALAETATLADFDGAWTGEWSWKDGSLTTLEIDHGKVKLSNFPASRSTTGETVVSGEGTVEFQSQWSTPAPCVLVTLPESELMVPIYITKDKEGLYYPVSTSNQRFIIFSRK